jgi:hypothetical protein
MVACWWVTMYERLRSTWFYVVVTKLCADLRRFLLLREDLEYGTVTYKINLDKSGFSPVLIKENERYSSRCCFCVMRARNMSMVF